MSHLDRATEPHGLATTGRVSTTGVGGYTLGGGDGWLARKMGLACDNLLSAVYLNFIGDEGEDRVVAGFGRTNYEKLAKVKAQYDPENVFHINHNIKPA